jgi:tyrosyl-tRNA synthetase
MFIRYVVFPILELKNEIFIINRDEKWGGPMTFNDYEDLTNNYIKDKVTPPDIKLGVTEFLIKLLEPLKIKFDNNNEIQQIIKIAYS